MLKIREQRKLTFQNNERIVPRQDNLNNWQGRKYSGITWIREIADGLK